MSKIITSFDIGIRNLAYCVLEYLPHNPSGNQFMIHDWNVIDLLNDDDKSKDRKCQLKYKNDRPCDQLAYYYNNNINICRIHSKAYPIEQLRRYYTVANTTLYELAKLSIQALDKIDFSHSQEIIIESQPSKNPKMKNFSMILLNYFIIRYIVEKPNTILKEVKFINSRNKLTVYDGPFVQCKLKNQHARNKFYGKVYCKYLIRCNPERLNFLDRFKKTDDLCDSFLQGAWYLLNNYRGPNQGSKMLHPPPLCMDDEKAVAEDEKMDATVGENEDATVGENEDEPLEETVEEKKKENLKPHKLTLKLKQPLVGKEYLKAIKNSSTTTQTLYDYHKNKYRQLKRGSKPFPNTRKYTLSNIKYIVEHGLYDSGNTYLLSSIRYYFGERNEFENSIESV